MNELEKYLEALEAAVEAKDGKAIVLLEAFATHLYKDLDSRAGKASGKERADLDVMLQRMKAIISAMAKMGLDLW
jgi:hypothetical protein